MTIFFIITAGTLLYNWQTIVWYLFYATSYFQLLFKPKAIENKTPIYIAINKNKKIVEYNENKISDYLLYYCLNYKNSNKVTNYKFINVVFKNDSETYDIELQNSDRTFYLVNNNILGKKFIEWYISSYLNSNINIDINYEITIIDNNANIITLTPKQYIILRKDSYEITSIS